MFERNLNEDQLKVFSKATVLVGSIFPNLSFVSPVHGSEGHLHNYLNFRVWRPLGPEKIEIWSWFMIDKAASDEYKEDAYKGYISSFGFGHVGAGRYGDLDPRDPIKQRDHGPKQRPQL